ncbi:MAG: hypothetical protein SXQ77_09685 [Halobacteria archaeon]|nr:hypothetical protein [Halobacteria archaeon]
MPAEEEKVCIGLRGWKFDPDDVFQEDGELKPIDDMPEDDQLRIVRLSEIVGNACHVCMLRHPEEGWDEWVKADVVYGEPTAEILTCDEHEADFLYWFFEEGGKEYKGDEMMPDLFHKWVKEGGEAPEGYEA